MDICRIMNAVIISIGEELLIGQTVNTNAAWIGGRLNETGISVVEVLVVTDDHDEIIRAAEYAMSRADLVIITGGLGPTRDDVTRNALCQLFDSQLVIDKTVLADIEHFFQKRGLQLTEMNAMQALVPDKAKTIRNPNGTAPGTWFEQGKKILISMPGVPFEMMQMMTSQVLPALKERAGGLHIIHKTVLTQGIGESFLSEKIADWESALPGFIKLAYLPSPGIVRLRLTGKGNDRKTVESAIEQETEKLKGYIAKYIWGFDDQTLEEITASMLLSSRSTLSTAESCTGGYIAHRITSVPGSSAYFTGSVVAYDNKIKKQMLHISEDMLQQHGAVSREVAEAMALNIKCLFSTDYSIAVSGIAGPGGASPEKPAGTVWIAVAGKENVPVSRLFHFGDSRERNIIRSSVAALSMLKTLLENSTV